MAYGLKLLLLYLSKAFAEYIYPDWISSSNSYTVFKNTRVLDTNFISSRTLNSFEDCIQSSSTDSFCKSVGLQIINNKTIACKKYSQDSPAIKKKSGYLFVTKKPARCSQSCNLKESVCANCKCQPSCAGRNRRQHICNCTEAGEKMNCQNHYQGGFNQTGIFKINPSGNVPITTLCEMNKHQLQNPACPFVEFLMLLGDLYYDFYLDLKSCITFCENEIYRGKSEINIAKKLYDSCECINGSTNTGGTNSVTFCRLGLSDNYCYTDQVTITGDTVSTQLYSKELCVEKCKFRYTENPDYRNYYLLGVNTQPQFIWCQCVFGYSNKRYNKGQNSNYISCIFQPSNPSQILASSSVWFPMMTRYTSWEADFWDKNYEAYQAGFGLVNQQWIGLENLYKITSVFKTNMRVDYSFIDGSTISTIYYDINVDTKENFYQFYYARYDARGSINDVSR